jgi:hypothetical protein
MYHQTELRCILPFRVRYKLNSDNRGDNEANISLSSTAKTRYHASRLASRICAHLIEPREVLLLTPKIPRNHIKTIAALGIADPSVLAKLREYRHQGGSHPNRTRFGPRCKGALISCSSVCGVLSLKWRAQFSVVSGPTCR